MCGIIGYVGDEDAVGLIVEGLKKLEYRGYDSAGLAVFTGGGFEVVKRKGRLSVLESEIAAHPLRGRVAIGHTRWATHGEPSDINSHPHLGSRSRIAVVHNGIIENHKALRERLQSRGIEFASQTDSEVIAQLAEYYYNGDIMDTVIKVAARLEGSYALGIMCRDDPDTLIAIKKDNPLIIGVSPHGSFLASDVPAVLKHTDTVYYPEDMEIAVLRRDGVRFYNSDKEPVRKEPKTITWSVDSAEKGGWPHFMLKEIMEQPKVLRDTIRSAVSGENKDVIDGIDIANVKKIVITACGSAYNAGIVAKYVFEKLCRTPVEVDLASEFRYRDANIGPSALVILISQSGETADTIAAMREAKAKGATTLAIVNVVGSAIAKESDMCVYTAAGPEIAVATTKAFSAQLALLYALAIRFAVKLGALSPAGAEELQAELWALPDKITSVLAQVDTIQRYAASCVGYKSVFYIGRNIDYAIALEGSLKLKEISYVHSEAYAGGELKHGPISLIEDETLVVAISNCERLYGKIMSNIEQVISRGAKVMLIGRNPDAESGDKLTHIALPDTAELFSPSLSVIVLQLFSYYVAANKGLDIDKPRNLAKSVTVE
ncbi:MAG: glutamine--fructose-6-phosphate transaminase (isomerizing) [Oscillospiraceae bacterium]|jgi:glucosamine--fructose-6-phosphate aminotransferase (isomerizing)|nr:glutamine--fructose-6-phosphate transaminase (isomerizing) [Oscillospiraceae bacterium]